MTTSRDPDRLIHAFIREGAEQLDDQVYDAVRAEIDQKRQRVVIGPWRVPTLSKLVPIGLGAAAVIAVLFIGSRFVGPPANSIGGPPAEPSPTPEPSVVAPTPSPTPWTGIAEGSFLVSGTDAPVQVTVNVKSPGWFPLSGLGAITKNDDGLDAPVSVGGAFIAWTWPVGTGINVYRDPCRWSTTIPETPATTPEEIAAAFSAQASTEPTAPRDVSVGGYAGKAITLRVPMAYDVPNATREERFGDCDNDTFAFYGIEGETGEARNAQGAGQVDELWIVDVNGAIVILDATYSPATPAELVEELRALAASATFE